MRRTVFISILALLLSIPFVGVNLTNVHGTTIKGVGLGVIDPPRKLFVLTIGINNYKFKEWGSSKFAVADAQETATAFEDAGKGLYVETIRMTLVDEQATKSGISEALKKVIAQAEPQDVFVFHFAGFGDKISSSQNHRGISANSSVGVGVGTHEFCLFTSDLPDLKPESIQKYGVTASLLNYWCSLIRAKQQLLILDSCNSEGVFNLAANQITGEDRVLQDRTIIALGTDGLGYESAKLKQGIATQAILDGLSGGADFVPRDGIITAKELEGYYLTAVGVNPEFRQRPQSFSIGDNFKIGYTPQKQAEIAQLKKKKETEISRKQKTSRGVVEIASPDIESESNKTQSPNSGTNYALLIATENYDVGNSWRRLNNPSRDVNALAQTLKDQYGFQVEILQDPSLDAIKKTLAKYKTHEYQPNDQLLIFFAGHGFYNEQVNCGNVVLKDSKSPKFDPFGDSFLRYVELANFVDNIDCNRIFLALDVCYGGTFAESAKMRTVPKDYQKRFASDFIAKQLGLRTRVYLTSGSKEYVEDGTPGGHSPFAQALLETLRENEKPYLTSNDLYARANEEIKDQLPVKGYFGSYDPGSEFLFIAHNGGR